MKKYIKYLQYIFRHKWYVFKECVKVGMIQRGITHDLSKLLPSEFFSYAEWFYNRPDAIKNPETFKKAKKDFEFSWLQHIKRNKHHWQWWILGMRNGKVEVFEMDMSYRIEMLCDWRGMSWVLSGKDNTKEWYMENKDKMLLGEETRKWVEKELL